VPGLQRVPADQAFAPVPDRPLFRPLGFVENPHRRKTSGRLTARGGNVPYLYRWSESNKGLDQTVAMFAVTGKIAGKTTVPILVNLTTGDLIGFARPLRFGHRLEVNPAAGSDVLASATLNGADATAHLFSLRGFTLGVPFTPADFDAQPQLPRMARGANDWIYLSVGMYDVKGLNHFFFSIADGKLYEAVFEQTLFDHSLFPSGDVARLEMRWIETEPASFEVHVPRYLVIEPRGITEAEAVPMYQQIDDGLRSAIADLRAAGVRSDVKFVPFVDTQPQRIRVTLPWVVTDRQIGSAGIDDCVALGGHFGETKIGGSRFE
jgi:hypothetical protein